MSEKLYHVSFEIQRGDSPMSRDGDNWPPATLAQHQKRLNEAAGPEGWGLHGYRVNWCVATSVDPPHTRVELEPKRKEVRPKKP
ncbi:MAG: hypothetical protein EBR82_22430 [Caulobacteraceae bacterium]|nr:hypothetical protein [Caulobacteraceae bacterium]